MKIMIWDLDYYYSSNKKNNFNPLAMKISSYHKQQHDQVLFVKDEWDYKRICDIYYVFKEKRQTPNPPFDFLTKTNVRWLGKAYKVKQWKVSNAILQSRPDYLLYPEHNTKMERSEHIHLFDQQGHLFEQVQDWTNSYKNKEVIVTDTLMWWASKNDIISALKFLVSLKNVYFLEPIELKNIIHDKDIKEAFLQIKMALNNPFDWKPIDMCDVPIAMDFIQELKTTHPGIKPSAIKIKHPNLGIHWNDKTYALRDFAAWVELILAAKRRKIKLLILPAKERLETPYWFLFEALADWTANGINISWLEFLSKRYNLGFIRQEITSNWNNPETWNQLFRDLLRQTYKNKELITLRWGEDYLSDNDIPWTIWEQEFKNEI